jgi:DNA-binding NtrC family response regulator
MNKPPAKILVVDDDPNLLDLLVDTLTTIGYEADPAEDGIKALELLGKTVYDLMISDIKMPVVDGIELLKRVRRYYPQLPVLLITGYSAPEMIGIASPDGFLAKPFRISRLEQLIEQVLGGHREGLTIPASRVLIVDDDNAFRKNLTEMLSANGYLPISAASGEEALRELQNGEVDAVISDARIPEVGGISLTRAIKKQRPDMPVILVTALGAEAAVDSGRADSVLQKPFQAENIVSLLKQLSLAPANGF